MAATRSASITGQKTVFTDLSPIAHRKLHAKIRTVSGYLPVGTHSRHTSGCAVFSGTPPEPADEVTGTDTPPAATPPPATPINYAEFEPEVLYQLLSAEVAGQRGRYDVTLVNYLQAAKTSRDTGVIERAMRIAQSLNADNAQQQLATLWLDVDPPDNLEAHRISAIQAVKRQKLENALFHMEQIMDQGEDADFDSLAAMAAGLPPAQQQELLTLYSQLAVKHPDNPPELQYSIALLQKITGTPPTVAPPADQPIG